MPTTTSLLAFVAQRLRVAASFKNIFDKALAVPQVAKLEDCY